MQKAFFYINSVTGELSSINEHEIRNHELSQILQIVGIDSGPIYKGSIQNVEGDWFNSINILHSKSLNFEGDEALNIMVGDFIVKSIKRIFEDINFEFEFINNLNGSRLKATYSNHHEGFKSLINLENQ